MTALSLRRGHRRTRTVETVFFRPAAAQAREEEVGLDQLQEQNRLSVIKQLELDGADTLLEIGSGWE